MSAQHTPDWRAVDPQKIATTCSPKHIQSVIEDARRDILAAKAASEELLQALRAVQDDLNTTIGEGSEITDVSPDTQALVRAAIAKATGGAA